MALPADFSKIFGSAATGGLTPIGDVNYAKGWEFVGSNPPTKNDFSYLQNLSDLKSQWLYSNKLQRTDPFGDIKADGAAAIATALSNLGLGTASKKNVGTGGGQIPDMSSFGISMQNPGWAKFPSGLIIQWGNTPAGSAARSITYPIPYPTNVILVNHFDAGWNSEQNGSRWGATNKTKTGFTANTDTASEGGQYFSIGY